MIRVSFYFLQKMKVTLYSDEQFKNFLRLLNNFSSTRYRFYHGKITRDLNDIITVTYYMSYKK